jgi:hypothetical protein
MATATATEKRVLTATEFDRVEQSYAPALNALKRKELVSLVGWLRRQNAKWRGQERRGVARGGRAAAAKIAAAGPVSRPGQAAKRKSFADALKRATARLDRLVAEEKRAAMARSAAAALARKRATPAAKHPSGGRRSGKGPQPIENPKTRPIVKGSKIGSISQATRNAQARRDNKGKK